ncbi:MAG: histidine ammonia-lyase [Pseudomonadales bacterium]|nr:histidine ammonia-lyase [Pseudomonadales bacterium]
MTNGSSSNKKYILQAGKLSLKDLREFYSQGVQLVLESKAQQAIARSCQTLQSLLATNKPIYGINTGFGLLAQQQIPSHKLEELQTKLVLSHAAGVGPLLSDEIVRLIMILKVNALAQGYSAVRLDVIEMLLFFLAHDIYPCIPSKGSVGASGDLAPLAHMSLPLIGHGQVRLNGEIQDTAGALTHYGLQPLTLGPKEGLALLNGTQVSTAIALAACFNIENIFSSAVVFGAMSVDAARGSDSPFDQRIHQLRGHSSQTEVARTYRDLLKGSAIRASHIHCKRVQDPYSLRCQPQVMGACLDQLRFAASRLEIESNGVTDNPLIFSDTGEILSGGNFHAEPVAMAADMLAIVIAEIGALSERRIALLVDHNLSDLPPFLVDNCGLNSGFMIPQVTAAALVSENKSLAHPASVDSLPTSANQEDHVSMATFAARRLLDMSENTAYIIAIEALAACQGVELRKPLTTSKPLQKAMSIIREKVPFYQEDRQHSLDIEETRGLVKDGEFNPFMSAGMMLSFA